MPSGRKGCSQGVNASISSFLQNIRCKTLLQLLAARTHLLLTTSSTTSILLMLSIIVETHLVFNEHGLIQHFIRDIPDIVVRATVSSFLLRQLLVYSSLENSVLAEIQQQLLALVHVHLVWYLVDQGGHVVEVIEGSLELIHQKMQAVLAGADVLLIIGVAASLQEPLHDVCVEFGDGQDQQLPVLFEREVDFLGELEDELGHLEVFELDGVGEWRVREEVREVGVSSIFEQVVDHGPIIIDDRLVQTRPHLQVLILAVNIVLLVHRETLSELLESHILILLFQELKLAVLLQKLYLRGNLQYLGEVQWMCQVGEPIEPDDLQVREVVEDTCEVLQAVLVQIKFFQRLQPLQRTNELLAPLLIHDLVVNGPQLITNQIQYLETLQLAEVRR